MPLYEYRCDKCGKQFEVMQKFSDEPLSTHETCGGAVHRLLSAPALQFKGSGWYITDYAKGGGEKSAGNGDSKKAETPAGTSSGGSESGSASSSSETKPEKKSSSSEKKSSSTETK